MNSAYSVASELHPERNEDSYFVTKHEAMGVFDGLGGHPGSEYASQLAAEHISQMMEAQHELNISPQAAQEFLTNVLCDTHDMILREQQLGRRGIATTAILAQVYRDPETSSQYAAFAYSGDSRAYLYRQGRFVYTTIDHSAAAKELPLNEQRRIQRHLATVTRYDQVDPFDWKHLHERNIVSACLGKGDGLDISTSVIPVTCGDTILLTSDGIHDNLTTREIRSLLGKYGIDAPRHLVDAAQYRSREAKKGFITFDGEEIEVDYLRPKSDDMTAVIRQL